MYFYSKNSLNFVATVVNVQIYIKRTFYVSILTLSNILQNKGSSTPGINVVLKNFANKPRIIPKSSLRDSNYTKFAKYFATKQHLITISSASI